MAAMTRDATSEHPLVLRRDIELDVGAEDLWPLVGVGAAWADWLVESADIAVEPAATGRVVDDDGTRRSVRIDQVVETERVTFDWWPDDQPERMSSVELVIAPRIGGSVLQVTETFHQELPVASASQLAGEWEARAIVLWSLVATSLVLA